MSKNLFITGTGTDVGKTYITALITKKLAENNINNAYYKCAMSENPRKDDNTLIPSDALFVKEMSKISQELNDMCPYIYEMPASPHLASKLEKNPIEMKKISDYFNNLKNKFDYITIEGSGGIICPLRFDDKIIMLEDFIKLYNLNCVIVANAGLGAINSVVLTAKYMKANNINIKGIIFNYFEKDNKIHKDNILMCEYLTGFKVLACVEKNDKNLNMPLEILLSLYN